MREKPPTDYKHKPHISPRSDLNPHWSVRRGDGTIGRHTYPDGSFKQFTKKDK